MTPLFPSCSEPLNLLSGDIMGSDTRQYVCAPCRLQFHDDASGLVIDDGELGWDEVDSRD